MINYVADLTVIDEWVWSFFAVRFKRNCEETAELQHIEDAVGRVACKLQVLSQRCMA